jgi:uncharacterized cupredoxin-like copper-binding protein
MKKLMLVPALALAGVGVAQAVTETSSVKATEVEFHIKLSAPSAKAGTVTFTVKNAGHLAHQFLVLKTKLAAGKLIGGISGAGLRAGASKTVALSLPPGHYVLFCNLPAHYKSGQYAAFTVK